MAIKGIYVSDGTTYTVSDINAINDLSFGGKVIYNDGLLVSAQTTPNMTVKVASGYCSTNGAFLQNTASYNVTIASNTASYARIDAIVAYISGNTRSIKVLQGTASATPSCPSCTASYYVKLAEVYVGVGASSIQASNVTDSRSTNNQQVITSLSEDLIDLKNKVAILQNKDCEVSEYTSGAQYQKVTKYNDGRMTIYQDFAMLAGVNVPWGNCYIHSDAGTTPTNFAVPFISVPRVKVSTGYNNTGASFWAIAKGAPTTSRGPIVQVCRATIYSTSTEWHIIIEAEGRWK